MELSPRTEFLRKTNVYSISVSVCDLRLNLRAMDLTELEIDIYISFHKVHRGFEASGDHLGGCHQQWNSCNGKVISVTEVIEILLLLFQDRWKGT